MSRALEILLADCTSSDIEVMHAAHDELTERLSDRDFDDDELSTVVGMLVEQSSSTRWEARMAVARLLHHLPDDVSPEVFERLLIDENAYVRREATKTRSRIRERERVRCLPMLLEPRVQKELNALEKTYNLRARNAAVAVGMHLTELMIDAMNHQVKAAMMPLGAHLEGVTSAVRRDEMSKVAEHNRLARSHLGRAVRVLNDSLKYVRRAETRFERVKLCRLVDDALESARHMSPASANGFAPDVDIAPDVELDASEELLAEAFLNVIKNAIEASAHRTPIPIHISAKRVKGRVEIAIEDKGSGMTKAECEDEIWRPYRSRKNGGTGLGLPLVKKIVEVDHRGRVRVTSRTGEGTTVRISLPAYQK